MDKKSIITKAYKYLKWLSLLFLTVSGIFSFTIDNVMCLFIIWLITLIIVLSGIIADSYLYYSNLDIEKSKKAYIEAAWFSEILSWALIFINFMVFLVSKAHVGIRLTFSILILVSSFYSMFVSDIVNDNHSKESKWIIFITYLINTIILCIQTF